MRSIYTTLVIALLAFLLGLAVFWGFTQTGKTITEQNATVLLEQIRKVSKLVTVEGDVSEVFNSSNTREVTIYLPLPSRFSFKKEALVQVKGTVLVGFNLEQLVVDIDEETNTLRLSNLPDPEILAIDHEATFKDLEESWFNSLTAEDYSAMNAQAREALRKKILDSPLMEAARLEGNGLVETMIILARGLGYSVELEGVPVEEEPKG
ncbi:MAG: hypothetical protein ACJAZ9_000096 [Neolewinella sp.]|jgi:hypothetical protein